MIDADALAQATIEHRDAGRVAEARAGYEQLLAHWSVVDDAVGQLRAAASELWLVRMAGDDDDPAGTRRHLEAIRTRMAAARGRSGPAAQWTLLAIEVAADLASLDLAAGDGEAAAKEIALGVAEHPSEDPGDSAGLDLGARHLAGLLQANGSAASGLRLLARLGGYLVASGEPLRAARAHQFQGLLAEDCRDDVAAFNAYRAGSRAVHAVGGREAGLLEAGLVNGLALAADHLGEYATAALGYETALKHRRAWLPENDPELLLSRYNVAELARFTGEVEFAARELTELIEPLRAAGKPSRWLLVTALKNLALARLGVGCGADAEQAAVDGLALGPDAQMRGQLLRALGEARRMQGRDPGVSDELAQAAATIATKHGEDSREHMFALSALAALVEPQQSSQIYARVVSTLEGDSDHGASRTRTESLCNLGVNRWVLGDPAAALAAFAEAAPALEEWRAELWRVRSALATRAPDPWPLKPPLVRMVVEQLADCDDARRLAFRIAVGSKRLQAETIAAQRELVLQGRGELLAVHELAARLRRSQAWSSDGDPLVSRGGELAQLEEMLARELPREALLGIAERSSAELVAEALPGWGILVEYVRLPGISVRHGANVGSAVPTYVAFVLPVDAPERMSVIDLGPAEPIEAAVEVLRAAIPLGAATAADWRVAARALAELIWDPLSDSLSGRRTTTFVAPDGALCAVPFDALIDRDGKPLLESTTFAIVATGRDAERFATRANWPSVDPIVIASPEFGEPWEPFGALVGSVKEGADVADRLDVDPVMAEAATRELLLGAGNAEILHLATHGYYLDAKSPGGLSARLTAAAAAHPLVSSGIALAGANSPAAEGEPGVVSALDVIGLDLGGTDLVVLSACESGLGPLDGSEGLLGLARSFLLAGARSVVWSLWRIDDEATADLIDDFYGWLLDESPRAAALRAAKLAAYADQPERVDVWAGFALQGDPDELLRYRFAFVPRDQIYTERMKQANGLNVADTQGRPFGMFEFDVGGDEPLTVGSMNMRNLHVALAHDKLLDGNRAIEAGRLEEAGQHFQEGLGLLEDSDVGHKVRSFLHARLALVTAQTGDLHVARQHGVAAIEGFTSLAGSEAEKSVVLDNLGITEINLGNIDGGRNLLELALSIKRAVLPPDDPQIQFTMRILRKVAEETGS